MEDIGENKCHLAISKITNFIYLGAAENAINNDDEFKKLNINVIINCASEIHYESNMGYIIEKFPMEDDDDSSLLEYIDDVNDIIHKHLTNGKKIYLHCAYGISRSPAVLIYYLMSHKQFTYDNALEFLQKIRPIIEINPNFERELRTIEEN